MLRKKNFFQSLILIFLLALTAIIIPHQSTVKNPPLRAQGKRKAFSKPFHDISEFRYTKIEKTRRIFTIQADRFRVQKKKLGFVRFGLMKEIIIDNARIDIYKPSDQKLNFQILTQTLKGSKTIGGVIPKSTGKVIFCPIIVQVLSQEGQILSRISGESATIDSKNKQFLFDRNVEIHSGNRILKADFLSIISKDGRVIARQGVELKSPAGTIISEKLQTDIFLSVYNNNEKGEL